MTTATGLQIAFLVLALNFLSMLLANAASRAAIWPGASADLLGQLITFSLAAALLLTVAPLRRFAAGELRRPFARPAAREIVLVAAAKVATPAAVIGLVAVAALVAGNPDAVTPRAGSVDPAHAWQWALSVPGLVQMVVVSWVVGPVIEEMVFRGLLYRAWARQWGWVPSLLLTSACFSLCHPANMASSFVGSVIYICVLRRMGTLLAPIAVHALFNFLVSWPLFGQVIMPGPRGDPTQWSSWAPFLACLAFTAVALPAYLLMARQDARDAAIA